VRAPRGSRHGRAPIAAVAALALALLALVVGCGKGRKASTAPSQSSASSKVEIVFPAARSSGVLYDTDIWIQFTEPLDPATINERTVFLKLDTVRLPASLLYDASSRRLRIVPGVVLALRRTYTVEISPGVETAAGVPLGQTYFWQFTTNSLRRPLPSAPDSSALDESPYALLRWQGTEATAGGAAFELYVGTDSAAVAARGIAFFTRDTLNYHLPRNRWALGTPFYWSVTAVNKTTGERLAGPVWRFQTLPPGTPVDSLVVPAADWGVFCQYCGPSSRVTCNTGSIAAGQSYPNYNNGIHWNFQSAAGRKLAGARLTLTFNTANVGDDLTTYQPTIHRAVAPWAPCTYSETTPKPDLIELAFGVQEPGTSRERFESDRLTSHLEATVRYSGFYGYSIRTTRNISFASPANASDLTRPGLKLYYYRLPPAPASAKAPAAGTAPRP